MTLPQIIGVSVVHDGEEHRLPAPNRHHNVIHSLDKSEDQPLLQDSIEGFYTDDGKFLDRRAAYDLATVNGQMLPRPQGGYQGDELFSEDLW